MRVPQSRVRTVGVKEVHPGRSFVLYWMNAARRPAWNYALDRAIEWSFEFRKPLVILEALRCGYAWASERLHAFVLQGMAANAAALRSKPVFYYPYVERAAGEGSGLLARLGASACVVVTDDFPSFFLPRMIDSAGRQLDTRLEAVDSNGLLPMRSPNRAFARAFDFRRFLQKTLAPHLEQPPQARPFEAIRLPAPMEPDRSIFERWPAARPQELAAAPAVLSALPIDHGVAPVEDEGGHWAANRRLAAFLGEGLFHYGERRNSVDSESSSRLSAYLHFGHISPHQIFHELAHREGWRPSQLAGTTLGAKAGWWNMSPGAEAFLDQLVTWRELGLNACCYTPQFDQYSSLPDWSKATLARHAGDARPFVYTLEQFEMSQTHDPIWNAAQRQLSRDGRIANYLRMLWGKKILHWSRSPQDALSIMIELNNKYAVDGRDPNSYSGIFWTLGRYDRPWPERPIFGKVRYMSSESTAKKINLKEYLAAYGPE